MDGGSSVQPSTRTQVEENVQAIADFLTEEQADIILLQEVDTDAKRSYGIDQKETLARALENAGLSYENSFACNFKTLYVPYPIPPIGKVTSGIVTFSAYSADSATRIALPCPFSYPIRLANLKRCLLVERIPLADSDRELVLVNLHLEAYDDGEGKAAQTAQLAELLREETEKENYVIVGGDFNQSFDVLDLSAYPSRGEGLWQPGTIETAAFSDLQCLQDVALPSCRSLDRAYDAEDENFQYYVVDGYLLSENIRVEEFGTVDLGFANSDHNPVRLRVTLQ
jgi:endonuclease/exonuclease/phosphatase family metal-dependent hydrolase